MATRKKAVKRFHAEEKHIPKKKVAKRKSVQSPTGKPSRRRAEIKQFDEGSPAAASRGGKRPPKKKAARKKAVKPPLVGGAYAGRKRKSDYDEMI